MTLTGSFLFSSVSLSVLSFEFFVFWVAVLIPFCFAVIFVFGESGLVFSILVGLSSVSNGEQRFLISIGYITLGWFFFIGSLLALQIPDFVGILSCRILLSICIISFFLLLQLFLLVAVSNSAVSLSCCVSNKLLCCIKNQLVFV